MHRQVTACDLEDDIKHPRRRQVEVPDQSHDLGPYAPSPLFPLGIGFLASGMTEKRVRTGEEDDEAGESLGRFAEEVVLGLLEEEGRIPLDI